MPLTLSPMGKEAEVRRIGGKEAVRRHLEELGIAAGSVVTVVAEAAGSMIISVKGARIAVGLDLANHIEVSPLQ